MPDTRKGVACAYCGAQFSIKYSQDDLKPAFCTFCGEGFDEEDAIEDEADDGDMDEAGPDADENESDIN